MSSMEFFLTGDVAVRVIVTEIEGTLQFDLDVVQPGEPAYTGQIGELNGLFFDMAGDVDTYSVLETTSGMDVLDADVSEGSVSNLGGGINVNGEVVKDLGKFDVGVELAETGLGNGDLQSISFVLSADQPLTLADVASMDFAVRLTSVGDPDGGRNGSSKIGGTAPEEPVDPPSITYAANDDTMTVTELEMFDGPDGFDFLTGFTSSMLANDTQDDGTTTTAYAGSVEGAMGTPLIDDPIVVTNMDGAALLVYADGRVDFSAEGQFDDLNDDDSVVTSFEYEIENGATAMLHVTVLGLGGDDDGGGLS